MSLVVLMVISYSERFLSILLFQPGILIDMILLQLGHEDHQFRLRFKGQYLRDAYTIEDYCIVENAILKMVPHAFRDEVGLSGDT